MSDQQKNFLLYHLHSMHSFSVNDSKLEPQIQEHMFINIKNNEIVRKNRT